MKVNKVTVTGADDNTSVEELKSLSEKYPFVEWGILFSAHKEGSHRYPSKEKISEIKNSGLQLSAHFCGWYAKEILERQNFSLIDNLPEFSRVQLNYNFSNSSMWNLIPLIEYTKNHPEKSIILQWNKSNKPFLQLEAHQSLPPNINFLYDSSGGRGVDIAYIQEPFINYTGYSGGLKPTNIKGCLECIEEHNSIKDVWIDMETGVRTGDNLDIDKVEQVLLICDKHIAK